MVIFSYCNPDESVDTSQFTIFEAILRNEGINTIVVNIGDQVDSGAYEEIGASIDNIYYLNLLTGDENTISNDRNNLVNDICEYIFITPRPTPIPSKTPSYGPTTPNPTASPPTQNPTQRPTPRPTGHPTGQQDIQHLVQLIDQRHNLPQVHQSNNKRSNSSSNNTSISTTFILSNMVKSYMDSKLRTN